MGQKFSDAKFTELKINEFLARVNSTSSSAFPMSEVEEILRPRFSLGMSVEEYLQFLEDPTIIFKQSSNKNLLIDYDATDEKGDGYSIETKLLRPLNKDMKKKLDFRGLSSIIDFERAIKDFQGNSNKSFRIRTFCSREGSLRYFCDGSPGYGSLGWYGVLDNQFGLSILGSSCLAHLGKPFFECSSEDFIKWQKQGKNCHKNALRKIKNLYRRGEQIPESFFDYGED